MWKVGTNRIVRMPRINLRDFAGSRQSSRIQRVVWGRREVPKGTPFNIVLSGGTLCEPITPNPQSCRPHQIAFGGKRNRHNLVVHTRALNIERVEVWGYPQSCVDASFT